MKKIHEDTHIVVCERDSPIWIILNGDNRDKIVQVEWFHANIYAFEYRIPLHIKE